MRTRLLFILLLPLCLYANIAKAQTGQKDTAVIRMSYIGADSVIDIDFRGSGEVRQKKAEAIRALSAKIEGVPAVAIRTNLLLPLMDLGVEVPLSNRFSIGAGCSYPWLTRNWVDAVLPPHKFCAQALVGSIEGRWWLGHSHAKDSDSRYRLRGHSIGAVLSGGYYDLEYDGRGQQGEFAAVGVDYLYSLPLGRGGIHLEFNIGVGVALNKKRNYSVPYEGGYLIADEQKMLRVVPVPIRSAVSLCVPIMRKESGHEK